MIARRSTGSPVPFRRLVRVELRKQVDTRAGGWLLGTAVVLAAGLVFATLFVGPPEELTWQGLTGAASLGWSLVLPLIGVLAATGEWAQRTAAATFVLEPRRTRVVFAKLCATCLLGLGVLSATLAVAAAVNAAAARWASGDGSWVLEQSFVVRTTGDLLLFVLMGLAFGLVLGRTAPAVAACLALPALWSVVLTLVPALHGSAPWLDLVSALTVPGSRSPVEWAHLATSVALWVGLPLLLGLERTRRRDVA